MNSRIRRHLDSIFRGFEDTQRLRDFKEELATNLAEKVADLQASGLDEDTAFREAIATLGDIRAAYAQGEEESRPGSVPRASKVRKTSFDPLEGVSFDPFNKEKDKDEEEERSRLAWGVFLSGLAVYLYLGFNNIAGGFGSWWMLALFFYGVYVLLRGGFGCGTVLILVAVLFHVGSKRSLLLFLAIVGVAMVITSLVKKGRRT
ncbi:MAG: permease prefix domain 1-containing protein [Bacillota bacterium]|jgi:hypothetical protein|nr:hypothetical protein [Candidatus Fermentithermobacillaceae bacterium]